MAWYYAVGDERRGPLSDTEFQVLLSNGTVRPDTLVWRDGMPDWLPHRDVTGGAANYGGHVGMRYAGFWIRFAAKIIDMVILILFGSAINIVLTIALSFDVLDDPFAPAYFAWSAAGFVLRGLYHTVFVGSLGATPGKLMLSLRVVRAEGSPVGFLHAFGRWVSASLNWLTLCIGWMMAGWNEEKCGLHDFICGTRVIHVD